MLTPVRFSLMPVRSFYGLLMRNQEPAERKLTDQLQVSFGQGSGASKAVCTNFFLVAKNDLSAGPGEDPSPVYEDDRVILAFDGRLDIAGTAAKDISGKGYGYKALLENIETDCSRLRGDFVIACFYKSKNELILIRDQVGTRPLYYTEQAGYFAFATEMKFLFELPGFLPETDEAWIADALTSVKSEKWRTPYKNILRLMPATVLRVSDALKQNEYWKLDSTGGSERMSYEEALAEFSRLLTTSVYNRIGKHERTGVEVSGGLDSSGVAGIASRFARESGTELFAFTHAFSESSRGKYFPYMDELEYSRELCQHAGIDSQVTCDADQQGILDMLRRNIRIQSGPTQQGYSMYSDVLYRRAGEMGIRKLLSGFGGDEGVSSRVTGYFDELAAAKQWHLFKEEYFKRAEISGVNVPRKYAGYVLNRYLRIYRRALKERKQRQGKAPKNLAHFALSSEFEGQLRDGDRLQKQAEKASGQGAQGIQFNRIMHNHVSQRFEYSCLDAKSFGIEYAYPLWDLDLLAFYYSLPLEYKFRQGLGRAIYRDALKDTIPERIRTRIDKSIATIPTVHQRFIHDFDRIHSLIRRSGEANRFHYADYDKMIAWQQKLRDMASYSPGLPGISAFINTLQVLVLQEMEREGEFKSGIRC